MQITFLVGNGFDISAGIDSSYAAFYKWYCELPSRSAVIEKFKNEIKEDIENGGETWADFEIGLGKHTGKYTKDTADEFLECYEDAHERIIEFLKEQEGPYDIDLFTDVEIEKGKSGLLNFYHELFPQEQRIFKQMMDADKEDNTVFSFISFNYTEALDTYVAKLSLSPLTKWAIRGGERKITVRREVIHAHGTKTTFPIIGVNDATQIANPELLEVPHFANVMIKPQSVEAVGQFWHAEAEQRINDSRIVCIWGMSIGASDAKWWRKLIEWLKANERRRIIVFWYTDNPPNGISVFKQLQQIEIVRNKLGSYSDLEEDEWKKLSSRIHVVLNTTQVLNVTRGTEDDSLWSDVRNILGIESGSRTVEPVQTSPIQISQKSIGKNNTQIGIQINEKESHAK